MNRFEGQEVIFYTTAAKGAPVLVFPPDDELHFASGPPTGTVSKQESTVFTQADTASWSSQFKDWPYQFNEEKPPPSHNRWVLLLGSVAVALLLLSSGALGYGFTRWSRGGHVPGAKVPAATNPQPSGEGPNEQVQPVEQPNEQVQPVAMPIIVPFPGSTTLSPEAAPGTSQPKTPTAFPSPAPTSNMTPIIPPTSAPSAPILEKKRIFLQTGERLNSDETKTLFTHDVYLKQQDDGNLVLHKNSATGSPSELWSSGISSTTGNYYTTIQGDGHMMTFRVTESSSTVVWKTSTSKESGGYRLVLNEDGTGLELLQSGITPVKVWSSLEGRVSPPPRSTPVILQSGPLVGHTTHQSTKIWFLASDRSSTVEVRYSKAGGGGNSNTVAMPPRDEHNGSSLAEIDGLEASTTYTYQILVDATPVANGQFTTAPRPYHPVKFKYLLTSCMNVRLRKGYPEQYVWDSILEKRPDFAMFNGDTVYMTRSDWNDSGVIYGRVWQRNLEQREEAYFAKFTSSVPSYMTWDDHDYGDNNAGSEQKGKENSLAGVKALWANPSYGTPDVTGLFYSYYWGNVHFIVMDGRWHRKKNWSQFGEEQLKWLYDQLLRSRAPFKIVVSGATITSYNDLSWIGQFITEHKIYGVLFNAGDIHRNEFLSRDYPEWPYKVIQFTSSGIARENWMRPWAMLHVDTEAADPTITASFYGAENEYTFSTWSNDPDMECTDPLVTDRYDTNRCTQTVRLSDLVPEGIEDLVLESPMGGDELVVGSQVTIVWRTFGSNVETVMLQYSENAGLTWNDITDDWIDNVGSYDWTIPSDPSVRVQVRVLADTSVEATNYGLMSIVPCVRCY